MRERMSAEQYIANQDAILDEYRTGKKALSENQTITAPEREMARQALFDKCKRRLMRESGMTEGDAIRTIIPEQRRW